MKAGTIVNAITLSAITVFVAIILIAPTVAQAAQPEFIQILEVDNYYKQVEAGESALFNWTAMNIDSDANLTVVLDASISGSGWTCSLVNDALLVEPDGLDRITVIATAPLEKGSTEANVSVVVEVYEAGYLVQVSSVSAYAEVVGAFTSADKVLGEFDNPLPAPLDNEWGVFLLDVIFWLAFAASVAFALDRATRILARKTTTMLDDIILGIVRTPILVLLFVFGIAQSLDALHAHIPTGVRSTILSVYGAVLVLVIFYLAYKLFKEIVVYYGKIVSKKTASKIDDVLIPVVEKLGVVVIGMAALGYVLGALNIDLTMFVAGGVVVSMVIAFAAQDTLSNFFSGMFLLMDRPFSEGDTIILSDGDWCEVRRIGMRTTRLYRYSDATMVSLPNNTLVNEKMVRVSNVSDPARVMVDIGVAYGTKPADAREAIMKAIKANPYSLLTDENKQPMILFEKMADSALEFKIILWINDRTRRMAARDRLVEEIYLKLEEAGIEIPFPQRVVHLKKDD
ncbi:MAG: mechanosensitive ion channel [Thermoplasmata archaeon]|nr:mechanosensitive ion channel [Thermoplasmata archaeon]